ncbi:MAG: right-handed parallel beta-helix repeat-containing protein [Paracoccaceae bacterium]|nr:right-handed parallel beta-helix repeat-containing protein [Paracoccaceae bacterium]
MIRALSAAVLLLVLTGQGGPARVLVVGTDKAARGAVLAAAAAQAEPGDTVLIAPGRYAGPQSFRKSGTARARITIRPQVAGTVTFDGTGAPPDTDLVTLAGSYLDFEGFAVVNARRSGIAAWQTRHVRIARNTVTGSRRAGIWVGATRPGLSAFNLVEDNTVSGNCLENAARVWHSGWSRAIAIDLSDRSIVRHNMVRANYGEGIGLLSTSGGGVLGNVVADSFSVGIYLDNAPRSEVTGNAVLTSGDARFYRHGQPARGIVIANEPGPVRMPSTGIVVTGNLLLGVGDVGYDHWGTAGGLVASRIAPNEVRPTAEEGWLLRRIFSLTGITLADGALCGPVVLCAPRAQP